MRVAGCCMKSIPMAANQGTGPLADLNHIGEADRDPSPRPPGTRPLVASDRGGSLAFTEAEPVFEAVADEDEKGDRGGPDADGAGHPKVSGDVVQCSRHQCPLF